MYPDPTRSQLEQENGLLTVGRKVVKALIHRIALQTPGVVELGGDSLLKRLLKRLGVRMGPRGIELELAEGEAAMTLTIVVRFGARVPELAKELRARVRRGLKEQLGIDVRTVNVHVTSMKGAVAEGTGARDEGAVESDSRDGARPEERRKDERRDEERRDPPRRRFEV